MINLKKCDYILKKYKDYDEQILCIKKLYNKNIKRLKNLQEGCLHDLILIYSNIPYNKKSGKCLLCGTTFALDENLMDYYTEIIYDQKYIIDITDEVSKVTQETIKNGENILFLRAKDKLEEIIKLNLDLTTKEIKSIIMNDLICYDRKLRGKSKILKIN